MSNEVSAQSEVGTVLSEFHQSLKETILKACEDALNKKLPKIKKSEESSLFKLFSGNYTEAFNKAASDAADAFIHSIIMEAYDLDDERFKASLAQREIIKVEELQKPDDNLENSRDLFHRRQKEANNASSLEETGPDIETLNQMVKNRCS